MRTLFANHTAIVGGAERSLLTMIDALGRDVEPLLACPAGDLATRAEAAGIRTVQVPGVTASFRLHPVHTPAGVLELARHWRAVVSAAETFGADLIHANSTRSALAAGASRQRPLVLHLRDIIPASRPGRLVRHRLARAADAVIANSRHTAETFGGADVIPNPIAQEYFEAGQRSRGELRGELDLPSSTTVFAVIAQITPWKGQDTAIRALAELRSEGTAASLLIVGAPLFTATAGRDDNRAYAQGLRELTTAARLDGHVRFLGHREDVPSLLRAADVVLMPSWEEPFGRSAAEAMAAGTPVVATSNGGPREFIADGDDGLLADPRDVEAWAASMRRLAGDEQLRARLGAAAQAKAARLFSPAAHARAVLEVYERCLRS